MNFQKHLKTALSCIVFLLAFGHISHAQWIWDPNIPDITHTINQVGIGTDEPVTQLHVKNETGSKFWQGYFQNGNTYVGLSHGLGYGLLVNTQSNLANNYAFLVKNPNLGQGNIINALNNGNVGIGIKPQVKLDVNGDVRAKWIKVIGNKGLFSTTYGTSIQAVNANYWRMDSNKGLKFHNNAHDVMGYLNHDANNSFGLLDADANWVLRSEKDAYLSLAVDDTEGMRLVKDGNNTNILIGTTTNPNMTTGFSEPYRLYVNGGGLFTEVKVVTG